jgi:hypothetical protein
MAKPKYLGVRLGGLQAQASLLLQSPRSGHVVPIHGKAARPQPPRPSKLRYGVAFGEASDGV